MARAILPAIARGLVCSVFAMALAAGLTGCPEPGDAPRDLPPGFTACGDFPSGEPQQCEPGEYCIDLEFSECATGCLDNDNCQPPAACVKPGLADVGACRDHQAMGLDAARRCSDACTKLDICGALTAAEAEQCRADCQQALDDAARLSLAECVEPWSCRGGLVRCLRLECGPSFPCPRGGRCLSGRCT